MSSATISSTSAPAPSSSLSSSSSFASSSSLPPPALPIRPVFFSWQSELPHIRHFLRLVIQAAIDALNSRPNPTFEYLLDEATRGEPGAPPILSTLLAKIDKAYVVISDCSFTNSAYVVASSDLRLSPNANVLVELGYALRSRGADRVLIVCDELTGDMNKMPFDIKGNRITQFKSPPSDKLREVKKQIAAAKMLISSASPPDLPVLNATLDRLTREKADLVQSSNTVNVVDTAEFKVFRASLKNYIENTEASRVYRPSSFEEDSMRLLHRLEDDVKQVHTMSSEWKNITQEHSDLLANEKVLLAKQKVLVANEKLMLEKHKTLLDNERALLANERKLVKEKRIQDDVQRCQMRFNELHAHFNGMHTDFLHSHDTLMGESESTKWHFAEFHHKLRGRVAEVVNPGQSSIVPVVTQSLLTQLRRVEDMLSRYSLSDQAIVHNFNVRNVTEDSSLSELLSELRGVEWSRVE